MADRLNGYRILILETREEAQFSRLLTEQGADVLQCPMFTIHDAPDPAPVEAWIRRSIEKPFDDVVLMTGEGLRRLMKVVRRIGLEEAFVASLGKARKFARGPKPGKALREIGLEPQMTTEKPTSEGVAEMLRHGAQRLVQTLGFAHAGDRTASGGRGLAVGGDEELVQPAEKVHEPSLLVRLCQFAGRCCRSSSKSHLNLSG